MDTVRTGRNGQESLEYASTAIGDQIDHPRDDNCPRPDAMDGVAILQNNRMANTGKNTGYPTLCYHCGPTHLQLGFYLHALPGVYLSPQPRHHDEKSLVSLAPGQIVPMAGSPACRSVQDEQCGGPIHYKI